MHYLHLFFMISLPTGLFIGALGTAIALTGPEDHPITAMAQLQFMQVANNKWFRAWQHYGITFLYFFVGMALIQFTQTWADVGYWLVILSFAWIVRGWLAMVFPKRTFRFDRVKMSFKGGKFTGGLE